jgi:hypothetical protein
LVIFYAGAEGIFFDSPAKIEEMIDTNDPDIVFWDTDLGPLPKEFPLLAERRRIEPITAIRGTGTDMIYIYRNTQKETGRR